MREDTRETISTSVLLYARATQASRLLKKLSGKKQSPQIQVPRRVSWESSHKNS